MWLLESSVRQQLSIVWSRHILPAVTDRDSVGDRQAEARKGREVCTPPPSLMSPHHHLLPLIIDIYSLLINALSKSLIPATASTLRANSNSTSSFSGRSPTSSFHRLTSTAAGVLLELQFQEPDIQFPATLRIYLPSTPLRGNWMSGSWK